MLQYIEKDAARYQWVECAYDSALSWNSFCIGSALTSRGLPCESTVNYLNANAYNRIAIEFER